MSKHETAAKALVRDCRCPTCGHAPRLKKEYYIYRDGQYTLVSESRGEWMFVATTAKGEVLSVAVNQSKSQARQRAQRWVRTGEY